MNLLSDDFTYELYDGICVCTGLSEKGYREFQRYNVKNIVSITLPSTTNTGDRVEGFCSKSDIGFGLSKLLTNDSPYVEIICPDTYKVYYGVSVDKGGNLDKLRNIYLNESLYEIKEQAFKQCTGLKEITIPESVKIYGGGAFSDCNNLVIDTLRLGGKSFGHGVFNNVSIKNIILDGTVEVNKISYEWGSFHYTKIGTVTITEGQKEIPGHLFRDCASIQTVIIPSSVNSIGEYAFHKCTGLKEITIPESVKIYGGGAFSDCNNLVIDTLRLGGKSFGHGVFNNVSIKNIILDGTVEVNKISYEWGSFHYTKIGTVTITEGQKEIPGHLFRDCASIQTVIIPSSVNSIGEYAFYKCTGLKEITIPESVTAIEENTFYNCDNLTIKGTIGSYVEKYAKDSNIDFLEQ